MPQPQKKLAHPFLDALVGSWDVSIQGEGPALKGGARFAKEVDGTALVEDLHVGEGASEFFGLGVMRLGDDGKTLKMWWFDSMGQGAVWAFEGEVGESGYDLTGDMMGTPATVSLHKNKKGDGLEFTMKTGDKVVATGAYAKAAKERAWSRETTSKAKLAPMIAAELGDWTIEGTIMGRAYQGAAWFRLGLGGAYFLFANESKTQSGARASFGVSAVAADGKTMKTWAFGNHLAEPLVLEATLSDTSVESKGTTAIGEMRIVVEKTETGLKTKTFFGDQEAGGETFTKKP